MITHAGCISLYTEGLYFTLVEQIYLPGDTVLITDIGTVNGTESNDTGTALVCVTTNINTQCCRRSDGGNRGEWYNPNGTIVPRGTSMLGFFLELAPLNKFVWADCLMSCHQLEHMSVEYLIVMERSKWRS